MPTRPTLALLVSGVAAAAGARLGSFGRGAPLDLDDLDLPSRFSAKATVKPQMIVKKKLEAFGQAFTLGCNYDVMNRIATVETTWTDSVVGGSFALTNVTGLAWKKTWFLPGITDAMTRVELITDLDLRTLKADAKLKLGLRRIFSKKGVSFQETFPLTIKGRGRLVVGCTVTVPEELEVKAEDLTSGGGALKTAQFGVDFDKLDMRFDF